MEPPKNMIGSRFVGASATPIPLGFKYITNKDLKKLYIKYPAVKKVCLVLRHIAHAFYNATMFTGRNGSCDL